MLYRNKDYCLEMSSNVFNDVSIDTNFILISFEFGSRDKITTRSRPVRQLWASVLLQEPQTVPGLSTSLKVTKRFVILDRINFLF